MSTVLSLNGARLLTPEDFRRWVLGAVALIVIGYAVISGVGIAEGGLQEEYAWRTIAVTVVSALGFVVAWRRQELLGSIIALVALWVELQLGFLTNRYFPSSGMLVQPVMIMGIGLLLGTRAATITTVVTLVSSTLAHRYGPLSAVGFTPTAVFWLTMHALSLVAAWALTTLSLSSLARVIAQLTSSDLDLADTIRFSPDGILILDGRGMVVLTNPSAEAMLDRAHSEIVGCDIAALLPEVPIATPVPGTTTESAGGPTTFTRATAAGTPRHIEVTWRRMERDRRQVLLRDVSARVLAESRRAEIESRLAHAQRLEAVGQLAGGLSHDFNNILTAVSGSAHLLRTERNPTEREALLDEIVAARDRGAALTRQLLSFARRDVVQPHVIDVAEHVMALERLLKRVAGDQVRLELALAPDCRVRVDPGQFEQALVNLVANARDAMPDGGYCYVTCGVMHADHDDEQIQVCVSDTGVGMATEIAERAFEPFFTTKPRGRGTGLGLAAVHGMVTQSSGAVRIVSAPGRGTQVSLEFPRVSDPVAPPAVTPVDTTPAAGGATILVAEDDDGTRRIVYRILRDAGHHVLLASDGLEAWQTLSLAAGSIDLLLTDVVMPKLTGPALAEKVRSAHPTLPVLFMTGYAEEHVRTLSGPQLVGDVVTKPFSGNDLVQRIATMLQRHADVSVR